MGVAGAWPGSLSYEGVHPARVDFWDVVHGESSSLHDEVVD